jgi:hypothetical protein
MADWKEIIKNWDKYTAIQKELVRDQFLKVSPAKLQEYFKKNPDAAKVYELAVGVSAPVFVVTSELENRLLNVFKEKLILRGFSDRYADREARSRRKDILEEASPAKSESEAIKLVEGYADRYSRLYPRVPPPTEITQEIREPVTIGMVQVEGRCPLNGRVMEGPIKHLEERGAEYEVKEGIILYYCPDHGYFQWSRSLNKYNNLTRFQVIRELTVMKGLREAPTVKGWICTMHKILHMKPEDIAKEFGLDIEQINKAIEECDKGLVQTSILPPGDEFVEMKKRGAFRQTFGV